MSLMDDENLARINENFRRSAERRKASQRQEDPDIYDLPPEDRERLIEQQTNDIRRAAQRSGVRPYAEEIQKQEGFMDQPEWLRTAQMRAMNEGYDEAEERERRMALGRRALESVLRARGGL